MKKLLTVFLALLMMVSVASVFVGCGGGTDSNGGGNSETVAGRWDDDETKEYNIVYYYGFFAPQAPKAAALKGVQDALSAVLKKKINATIELHPFVASEYTQKMNGLIAANTDFDVCFTSPKHNPYAVNVHREAFEEIPMDMLKKYAPHTYERFDAKVWDQAKINGKLYATINEQILARVLPLSFPSPVLSDCQDKFVKYLKEEYPELAKKYAPTAKSDERYVKDGIDLALATEFFAKDSGHNNDVYGFVEDYFNYLDKNKLGFGIDGKPSLPCLDASVILPQMYHYDPLMQSPNDVGAVKVDGDTKKVVNQFKSPEFKELIDKIYEWKAKGWINSSTAGEKNDLAPNSTWKPSGLLHQTFKIGDPYFFTSWITGTMNAISSNSKNPARTLKFIELLSTDKEVHNLLQFGIEGKDYKLDPKNPNRIAEYIPEGGYSLQNAGWELGSEYIALLRPGEPDDVWERTKKVNDTAVVSDIVGFNPDLSKVAQKAADCRSTVQEYVPQLTSGTADDKDATMAEFLKRLDIAGAEEVLSQLQKELDTFHANKK